MIKRIKDEAVARQINTVELEDGKKRALPPARESPVGNLILSNLMVESGK